MAGSFNHIVNKDTGALRSNASALSMLDCHHGDVFEALEEMYGMIWYLAWVGALGMIPGGMGTDDDIRPIAMEGIETARVNYRDGLAYSPTSRYRHNHDWKVIKVESYDEQTLLYRCVTCNAEIVHPAREPAPPKR